MQQRRGARARRARVGEDDEHGIDTCPFSFSYFLIFATAHFHEFFLVPKQLGNFMQIFVEMGEEHI